MWNIEWQSYQVHYRKNQIVCTCLKCLYAYFCRSVALVKPTQELEAYSNIHMTATFNFILCANRNYSNLLKRRSVIVTTITIIIENAAYSDR